MLVGELLPGVDHDRDRVAFIRQPVESGTSELEATARYPAGACAAGRERRGDRRCQESVPFVREQPFRHFVAGSERMGDPIDGQGPLDRPRGEPEHAAPGLRASREVEDLDMRVRHPFDSTDLSSADVRASRERDLFLSAEVQVEPEHPLLTGRGDGAALARAFDPPCSRPGAFPGGHVQHLASQAQDGGGHRSRRGGDATRDCAGHPERGLERAPASKKGKTAGGDAGNREPPFGRRSPGREPRQDPGVPGCGAILLEGFAGGGERAARGGRHQLVPGNRGHPVVEPVVGPGGRRLL